MKKNQKRRLVQNVPNACDYFNFHFFLGSINTCIRNKFCTYPENSISSYSIMDEEKNMFIHFTRVIWQQHLNEDVRVDFEDGSNISFSIYSSKHRNQKKYFHKIMI